MYAFYRPCIVLISIAGRVSCLSLFFSTQSSRYLRLICTPLAAGSIFRPIARPIQAKLPAIQPAVGLLRCEIPRHPSEKGGMSQSASSTDLGIIDIPQLYIEPVQHHLIVFCRLLILRSPVLITSFPLAPPNSHQAHNLHEHHTHYVRPHRPPRNGIPLPRRLRPASLSAAGSPTAATSATTTPSHASKPLTTLA
jgi:hypothetical protein